jgi:hypothetical protein
MGRMNPAMQMVALMQEFGWTYEEYMATPTFVIKLIVEKMRRDRKEQELAAKHQSRGN